MPLAALKGEAVEFSDITVINAAVHVGPRRIPDR
jgi:hypothetical protein